MFGLGLLSSAQGWERLHAFLKVNFPVLTSGKKGCEERYLQYRNLLHVTSEHPEYRPPNSFSYKPHSSRHRFECTCCEEESYECLQCEFTVKNKRPDTPDDGGAKISSSEPIKRKARYQSTRRPGIRVPCSSWFPDAGGAACMPWLDVRAP